MIRHKHLARFAFWGLFWPAGPAGIPLIGIALVGSGAVLLALRGRTQLA